jgi:hypothetical protein
VSETLRPLCLPCARRGNERDEQARRVIALVGMVAVVLWSGLPLVRALAARDTIIGPIAAGIVNGWLVRKMYERKQWAYALFLLQAAAVPVALVWRQPDFFAAVIPMDQVLSLASCCVFLAALLRAPVRSFIAASGDHVSAVTLPRAGDRS